MPLYFQPGSLPVAPLPTIPRSTPIPEAVRIAANHATLYCGPDHESFFGTIETILNRTYGDARYRVHINACTAGLSSFLITYRKTRVHGWKTYDRGAFNGWQTDRA